MGFGKGVANFVVSGAAETARRRRRVAGGKVWRRLRAGGSAGSGFRWDFCAARVPCSKQAGHQRRHAQGHDPEHQMTHHLGRAAHPHPASAVAALEQAVDALAKAARWRGGELPLLATARVVVDDRLVILLSLSTAMGWKTQRRRARKGMGKCPRLHRLTQQVNTFGFAFAP